MSKTQRVIKKSQGFVLLHRKRENKSAAHKKVSDFEIVIFEVPILDFEKQIFSKNSETLRKKSIVTISSIETEGAQEAIECRTLFTLAEYKTARDALHTVSRECDSLRSTVILPFPFFLASE